MAGRYSTSSARFSFRRSALRELLIEAIRYGDQPEVRARLTQVVANALDRQQLQDLLEEHALAHDSMDASRVLRIREEMERAEARRLQPHYIESFFLEAFKGLGGAVRQREPRRFEVTHVPAPVRNRDRLIGIGEPVLPRYERIVFEKSLDRAARPAAGRVRLSRSSAARCDTRSHLERHRDLFAEAQCSSTSATPAPSRGCYSILSTLFRMPELPGQGERRVVSKRMLYVEMDAAGNARTSPLCALSGLSASAF